MAIVKNPGIKLRFDTHGNEKQKEVAKLWNDNVTSDIVYGGSKGCFVPTTKIKTNTGFKFIKDMQPSDTVVTMNEKTGLFENNKVLELKKYLNRSSDEYHKIISFVFNGGHIISMTTNHELFIGGFWVAAGELARRVLGKGSGFEWEVSDFNKGQSCELWTEESNFFNPCRLSQVQESRGGDRRGEDVDESSPISCYGFYSKSRQQTSREPHRFRSGKQRQGQSRVGYSEREYSSLEGKGASIIRPEQRWGELETSIDCGTSIRNQSKVQALQSYPGNAGEGIRSSTSDHKGYNSPRELEVDLIEEIRFELVQGYVYDLHVENNHNYCVSEESIIVHNSGKTFLLCNLIFGDAFTYPGTNYFIARKTLADLRKHTMKSIAEVFKVWNIPETAYNFNHKDNEYRLYNGSTVLLTDAKYMPSDPTYARFGGWQITKGAIEESGDFDEGAKNNLMASIGRWKNDEYNLKGKLLQTCNPSKNYLYREYYKPHKEGRLPEWRKFIQALPQDNKMLASGYLENLYNTLNPTERKRLLEGDWEYDDDPSVLIDYDRACEVFTNTLVPGQKYITSDIARLGGDRIVIIGWNGFGGTVESFKRELLPTVTAKIEATRKSIICAKSSVLVDGDGIGSGVQDFGGFKGFRNNARALPDPENPRDGKGRLLPENYDNVKSQCGFRMAERINNNGLRLVCKNKDDEKFILQEMEHVKQKNLDSDLKKGLLPKDKVRDLLGRSPDFWDAILMREFFELQTPGRVVRYRTGNEQRLNEMRRDPYYYPELNGN